MNLTPFWLFHVLLVPLLLVVAIVDARTGRIPDAANAAILLLGAARAFVAGPEMLGWRFLDAAIAGALLLLLRLAYRRARGRQGLGLGDVKFLVAATLWTGLEGLPVLVLLASLAALLGVGLSALWSARSSAGIGWETRLRFGPYLALALFVVVVMDPFVIAAV